MISRHAHRLDQSFFLCKTEGAIVYHTFFEHSFLYVLHFGTWTPNIYCLQIFVDSISWVLSTCTLSFEPARCRCRRQERPRASKIAIEVLRLSFPTILCDDYEDEFMCTSLTSRLDQYQETRRYRASHHRHNCHVAQVLGGYAESRLSICSG